MDDLAQFFTDFDDVLERNIAVAVSGGPDSMALCAALCAYLDKRERDTRVYVYTVNHNLREEAQEEADAVGRFFSGYARVIHKSLSWERDGELSGARMQESARAARYDLMAAEMDVLGLTHLFLGHHQDDQAETFLFRLAKGSGLDGLAGMAVRHKFGDVTLCRPFLGVPKTDLVDYCVRLGITYFSDRSNYDPSYARVRLRQSMAILKDEGLSAKRISRLCQRVRRARLALEYYAEDAFTVCVLEEHKDRIVFNFKLLQSLQEEIFFRVIDIAVKRISIRKGYGVRQAKLERLCHELLGVDCFRKQTLGGVVFEVLPDEERLVLEAEKP